MQHFLMSCGELLTFSHLARQCGLFTTEKKKGLKLTSPLSMSVKLACGERV